MGLSAPARTSLATAVAAIAVTLGGGCGNQIAMQLHGSEAADAQLGPGINPETVERTRRRRASPAQGVAIEATLWDGALIAAGLSRGRTQGDDESTLSERREHWVESYIAKRTAFTVVIELANRQTEPGVDPLTAADAWTFVLDRGAAKNLEPVSVELQAVDRFPTEAGGAHVRLGFAVVFAGAAWPDKASEASKLRLRVRAAKTQAGMKRPELGLFVAKRGAAMSWWVVPAT